MCVCVCGGWGVGGGTRCFVLCVERDGGVGGSGWLRLCGELDGRGGGVAMDCRGVDCMCVTLLEVYT